MSAMMRITEDATTAPHTASPVPFTFTITSGQTYTVAFDARNASGSRWVQFNSAGTGIWGNFNPSSGATGSSGGAWQSAISLKTESLGSDGYRCKLTFTASSTQSADFRIYLVPNSASAAAASYAGDGTSAVDISWVQIENLPDATSRIKTVASSVTRAADVFQFVGPALTALQGAAGSVIGQVTSLLNTSATKSVIGAGVINNSMLTFANTTAYTWSSGATLLAAPGLATLTSDRMGVAWSGAGRSVVLNGGAVASDANTISGVSAAYLGSVGGSSYFLSGWVKSFAIYSQRLPDATLQAKSVVGASYAANDNGLRFADNDNLPIHWRVAL